VPVRELEVNLFPATVKTLFDYRLLLAKILTVGLGHELCDRAWQLGLLTVYGITAKAVAIHIYHKKSS
jgi:hypothetical protein